MENEIAVAAALYEEEKKRLQMLIKECLEDLEGPNYLLANHHQTALYQVQQTLHILYNLDDALFDEKERALKSISFLEETLKTHKSSYTEQHLQNAKITLAKLQTTSKAIFANQEENILEKAIFNLVHKKVKKFKLVLNNSKQLYLQFISQGNTVKITLPNIKKHIKDNTLYESQITHFQKYGFEITIKNTLVRSFQNKGEETISHIKMLLVNIIFKIFYFKAFDKQSYIEF